MLWSEDIEYTVFIQILYSKVLHSYFVIMYCTVIDRLLLTSVQYRVQICTVHFMRVACKASINNNLEYCTVLCTVLYCTVCSNRGCTWRTRATVGSRRPAHCPQSTLCDARWSRRCCSRLANSPTESLSSMCGNSPFSFAMPFRNSRRYSSYILYCTCTLCT